MHEAVMAPMRADRMAVMMSRQVGFLIVMGLGFRLGVRGTGGSSRLDELGWVLG